MVGCGRVWWDMMGHGGVWRGMVGVGSRITRECYVFTRNCCDFYCVYECVVPSDSMLETN